jgi:hypothetical protein
MSHAHTERTKNDADVKTALLHDVSSLSPNGLLTPNEIKAQFIESSINQKPYLPFTSHVDGFQCNQCGYAATNPRSINNYHLTKPCQNYIITSCVLQRLSRQPGWQSYFPVKLPPVQYDPEKRLELDSNDVDDMKEFFRYCPHLLHSEYQKKVQAQVQAQAQAQAQSQAQSSNNNNNNNNNNHHHHHPAIDTDSKHASNNRNLNSNSNPIPNPYAAHASNTSNIYNHLNLAHHMAQFHLSLEQMQQLVKKPDKKDLYDVLIAKLCYFYMQDGQSLIRETSHHVKQHIFAVTRLVV